MTSTELVKQSFSHGWQVFVRRPWFMFGSVILVFGVSVISSAIAQSVSEATSAGAAFLLNAFDFIVVQILVSMGIVSWSLKAAENVDAVRIADLWSPHQYFKFLGAALLVAIIEIIGFGLFIIPGIIASAFLLFVSYIVIDRRLGPIDAIQKSFEITKEHFWGVLLLILTALVVNIAGAIVFGIGLLVTIPVTVVAIAHAYRTLSQIS